MAPPLASCCRCCSLKFGTVFSGVCGILLAIIGIVVMLTLNVHFHTIVLDWLPQWIVKIIFAINLCMTIFISILLIVGAIRRNWYLMLPWVLLGIMLAVGLLVSVIYTAVVCFIDGETIGGVLWLVLGLISVLIYVYMWLVVYSYFTIIKEEYDRGAYQKAPFRREK